MLVVLDDLHWADSSTRELLELGELLLPPDEHRGENPTDHTAILPSS